MRNRILRKIRKCSQCGNNSRDPSFESTKKTCAFRAKMFNKIKVACANLTNLHMSCPYQQVACHSQQVVLIAVTSFQREKILILKMNATMFYLN